MDIPGISQRDMVYYEHLNNEETRSSILNTVLELWTNHIRLQWMGAASCTYHPLLSLSSSNLNPSLDTFDLLLTKDLSKAHIVDFNPFLPKTDPLLFTYEDLFQL